MYGPTAVGAEAGNAEVDDRRLEADRGEVAVVGVAERKGRLGAQAAQQIGGGGAAHLLGGGLPPGAGIGSPKRGWLRALARSLITAISA